MGAGNLLKILKFGAAPGFVVVAALLIYLYGPRVGLVRPWNFVVAGILLLVTILVYLIWWLVQKRMEKKFVDGMVGQAEDDASRATVSRREEIEDLVAQWKDAVKLLRQSSGKGGNVLKNLPWFMIIGEPQSGKSTILRNSGLDFPIGDAAIRGIGGTKNCDWWFANEGIVLDTAGRYAFEVQNAPDRAEWDRFLGLLKRTRKNKTINALLVTIPTDTLLRMNEDELRFYSQHLRGKINDLITRLGIVFPVYLIVTKSDLVEGFVDFFQRYPASRVREAVGRTIADARSSAGLQAACKTLDDLYDRLCSMSLRLMVEGDTGAPSQPYLLFPEEFRNLTERLKALITDLLRENIYMENPLFRGIYFTSGTQEGRTIATAFAQVADNLQLDSEILTTLYDAERAKRTYFVRDLLSQLLIEDAARDLVRPAAQVGGSQVKDLLLKFVLPTAAVASLFLVWSIAGYASNRSAWIGLRDSTRQVARAGESLPARPEADDMAEGINDLGDLRAARGRALDRSAIGTLFLKRSDPDPRESEAVFTEALEARVLIPTLERMRDSLVRRPSSISVYLQDLDAYLAYRRAVEEESLEDPSRLEGLLGPWLRDEEGRLKDSHEEEFAALVADYIDMGGREKGPDAFPRVASRLAAIDESLRTQDPVSQLRDLSVEAERLGGRGAGSDALDRFWEQLRALGGAGEDSVELPEDLLARIRSDAEAVGDARPILAPLGRISALAQAPGARPAGEEVEGDPRALFEQSVRAPLQAALEAERPRCPRLTTPDPAVIEQVVEEVKAYRESVSAQADEVVAGIEALNAGLPEGEEEVRAAAVKDLIIQAKVSGVVQECTGGWFGADGALSADSLLDACGGGGGRGRAAPTEWIGPTGAGLFQCLVRKSAGGGPQVDRECLRESRSSVAALLAMPELPADMRRSLQEQSTSSFEAAEPAVGSVNWGRALAKIELSSSPESWTLDQVAARIRGDRSLQNILTVIQSGLAQDGRSTAAIGNFNVGAYANSLTEIADALDTALADSSGRELTSAIMDAVGSRRGDTPYERALRHARGAPHADLKAELENLPRVVWEKMVLAAQRHLDDLYQEEIRGEILRMRECYPFSREGVDCEPAQFSELFGPVGAIGRLAPFAEDNSATVRTRFGAALDIGPGFRGFLRSAVRIHRAFAGDGAGGEGAFRLTFEAAPAQLLLAPDIKEKNVFVVVGSAELILGEEARFPITRGDDTVRRAISVPVVEEGRSRVKVELEKTREVGMIEGFIGREYTMESVELGRAPRESGPWSFLRLMERGSSGEGCCSWEVPVLYTKKKGEEGEQVAAVRVDYAFSPPRGGSSILSRDFWALGSPPESVTD
jgi:hypothetical protein